jgi:opacity protein-like surface antigen
MMKRTIFLAAFAMVLAAPAAGAQQQYGRDSNVWRWDGRVDAGRWMHIFNVNGQVDFVPSTDNNVHVVAEKRSNGREMDDIHYEIVQSGGNVTICAIWNNNSRCEDGGMDNYRNNDHNETHSSVRFTVQVPKSVRVGAHSVNGGVSVRDVGAEVRANTVNGGVVVRNGERQRRRADGYSLRRRGHGLQDCKRVGRHLRSGAIRCEFSVRYRPWRYRQRFPDDTFR